MKRWNTGGPRDGKRDEGRRVKYTLAIIQSAGFHRRAVVYCVDDDECWLALQMGYVAMMEHGFVFLDRKGHLSCSMPMYVSRET